MPSLLSHGTSVKIVSSERLPNICLIPSQSFGYWRLLFNPDFYWNGEIYSVKTYLARSLQSSRKLGYFFIISFYPRCSLFTLVHTTYSSAVLPYLVNSYRKHQWGLLFNSDFYRNGDFYSVQTIWLGILSLQENQVIFFYQLLPKVFKVPMVIYHLQYTQCSPVCQNNFNQLLRDQCNHWSPEISATTGQQKDVQQQENQLGF